jgi:hypothetical protein
VKTCRRRACSAWLYEKVKRPALPLSISSRSLCFTLREQGIRTLYSAVWTFPESSVVLGSGLRPNGPREPGPGFTLGNGPQRESPIVLVLVVVLVLDFDSRESINGTRTSTNTIEEAETLNPNRAPFENEWGRAEDPNLLQLR